MKEREPGDFIEKRARDTEKSLVFGRISKVWDKQSDDIEEGNIEVNILTKSGQNEIRRVPLTHFDHPGHVVVPQEGDPVVVDYASGRGRTAVAVASSHDDRDSYRAPNALAGHWRHEWPGEDDSVYLEAEPGDGGEGMPDLVRMGIKPDALEEASTEVAVDNSGTDPEIRVDLGDGEQGLVLDGSDGSFKLLDESGFGIESDGDGNFTWHMNSVDFNDEDGPITLDGDE